VTTHVTANGLRVAFHVEGSGPPLVLLHGASSTGPNDFAAQLPRFARSFRCYLPDARGHAGTRWDPAAGLRYGDLAVDLDAFADACDLGTFHLLGFSMGAATALLYAIRRPDRLRTLILVGTSPELEPRTRVIRHLADVARIDAQDPAWAAALARRHDPVQGAGAWRRLMPAIVEMVEHQPVVSAADLRRVEVPTLVVVGDRDPFVPVPQAWQLSRQLPGSRLAVIPGAGHEAMAHQPGVFSEACASFWRSAEATAAARPGRVVAQDPRGSVAADQERSVR
jgi:pimeloyl-ACP methyl ester carboxylesterase